MHTITQGGLTLTVSDVGAELTALTASGYDRGCLWDGDPAVWARRAPVCFPYCGRMDGGYFEEGGKRYEAGIHGFVRDMTHTLIAQGEDFLRFRLEVPADETRWPWAFSFETEHRLAENRVVTTCTAVNCDGAPMPAQLGFHTALRCPFGTGKAFEDYFFRFQCPEAPDGTDILPITKHLFDSDSICFEGLASRWIQVEERGSGKYLRMGTADFPYVLLWSQIGSGGFVCIEPWTGYPGPGHDLSARPGTSSLAPGASLSRTQILALGTRQG